MKNRFTLLYNFQDHIQLVVNMKWIVSFPTLWSWSMLIWTIELMQRDEISTVFSWNLDTWIASSWLFWHVQTWTIIIYLWDSLTWGKLVTTGCIFTRFKLLDQHQRIRNYVWTQFNTFLTERNSFFMKSRLRINSTCLEQELCQISHFVKFVCDLSFSRKFILLLIFSELNFERPVAVLLNLLDLNFSWFDWVLKCFSCIFKIWGT